MTREEAEAAFKAANEAYWTAVAATDRSPELIKAREAVSDAQERLWGIEENARTAHEPLRQAYLRAAETMRDIEIIQREEKDRWKETHNVEPGSIFGHGEWRPVVPKPT